MQIKIFEFLAVPAHAWLWLVAAICGMRFQCGAAPEDDEECPLCKK